MVKPAVHQGTCGVCEQQFKVRDQKVVLHGYKRPGDGYIDGRCFGEGMVAWEISPEAAKAFLATVVVPRREALAKLFSDLDAGRVTSLVRRKPGNFLAKVPTFETIGPDHPAWSVVFTAQWSAAAAELEYFTNLVNRLERRIYAWAPGELVDVAWSKAKPRYMRVVFVEAYGEWCATSLGSGRSIARGRNLEYLMAATSNKGWSLPPGTEPPVEVRAIDLFRKAAALPDPENRRVQVRDVQAAPIVAKMVVAAYAGLTVDQQRQIDGRRCQDIVYDVARVEYFADALTVEKVRVALVGSFIRRTGF